MCFSFLEKKKTLIFKSYNGNKNTEMVYLGFTAKESSGGGWGSDGRYTWNKVGRGLILAEESDGLEGVSHAILSTIVSVRSFLQQEVRVCVCVCVCVFHGTEELDSGWRKAEGNHRLVL